MSCKKLPVPFVLSLATALGAMGCEDQKPATPIPASPPSEPTAQAPASDDDGAATAGQAEGREAEAEFQSAPNMKIRGEAELEEVADGVRVEVELDGAPAGEKGLHIHETADCSDIPNKSMGGHFSPKNHDHGLPSATEHHVGDLGNIRIGEDGKGKLTFTVVGANLKEGDPMGLIGKSVVLHESNDKGTGKAGDAGSPVACAPIKSS